MEITWKDTFRKLAKPTIRNDQLTQGKFSKRGEQKKPNEHQIKKDYSYRRAANSNTRAGQLL